MIEPSLQEYEEPQEYNDVDGPLVIHVNKHYIVKKFPEGCRPIVVKISGMAICPQLKLLCLHTRKHLDDKQQEE